MKIAFHLNELSLRGTGVAVYDYARYSRSILGCEPVILTKRSRKNHDPKAVTHFRENFEVFDYRFGFELSALCKKQGVDVLYAIKGEPDRLRAKGVLNVVHGVFETCPPHGDRFAYVSEWLSEFASGGKYPGVPHIVDLPTVEGDLRNELGIPSNATVIGRHEGWDTFDLEFAHQALLKWVDLSPDHFFVGLNTKPFGPVHPRIILLPSSPDISRKVRFINTCNAMLHARSGGESFGLAVGEFSFFNKPVFTWADSKDKSHLQTLGEQALAYHEFDDLYELLTKFDPKSASKQDWSAFRQFSPEKVMARFKEVFLDA